MGQGDKNESKLRLHTLQSETAQGDKVSQSGSTLRSISASGEKSQNVAARQTGSHKSKTQLQTFNDIRDPYKSMVRLIDSLFDLLQAEIYGSNKEIGEIKLQIHLQRPSFEKQISKSWLNNAPEQPAFVGKIYTYDWSLILKGTSEIVNCYVIPSDRVISFNSDPDIYQPYLSIKSFKNGSNFGWQIEGKTLKPEYLKELTGKLFEKLLKSIKSQQWNESTFCLPSIGVGLSVVEGKKLGDADENNLRYDPEQILSELMKAAQEALPKPDEFKIASQPRASSPSSAGQTSTRLEALSPDTLPDQTFEHTLKLLLAQLGTKLEQLVDLGSKALNEHDFQTAQRVLTLTNQLDEFKQKANDLLKNL